MRRVFAALLCLFLLAVPVRAANAAPSVSTTAKINDNGEAQVTIEVRIRLDDPARNLKFPLGTDVRSVTLNGSNAPVSQSGGITSVDLSHLDGKMGLFSCTIGYTVNSVVETDEDGKKAVSLPLLYGFPYSVESMSFSVTMPSEFDTIPVFRSGYHGQDIERQMEASISGAVITGRVAQELKDSETLFLTLEAPEGMFPATHAFGGTLAFDAAAMGICAAVAMLCWLLTMRCLPRLSPRRPTVPEGICAGQMATYLVRQGAELPIMVLQWAQLGYLTIHLDRSGRVFLHKKMDMGNERSVFELRCFRDLFGRRQMMDTSSSRFQAVCVKTHALSRRQNCGLQTPKGSYLIFRMVSAAMGLFAGVAMGDSIATDHTWRLVIMATLGILCAFLCWLVQDGMKCLHLRGKAELKLSWVASAVLLFVGFFCGCLPYGLAALTWNLLAGLMAAYSGIRSDNGHRIRSEILGLRRYMRKATPEELQRILSSNRNYYFELSPYALAFGLDKSFAEKFGSARLPACTWLTTGSDIRTAPEWYTQLRRVYSIMSKTRKPTLAERIFGK